MKPSLLKYIAIFNLLLGVALLLSFVLEKGVSRRLDDFFLKEVLIKKGEFARTELKDAQVDRVYTGEEGGIYWQLTSYMPVKDVEAVLVEAGDDPDRIFHENPMSILDYAVAFYNLRYGDEYLVSNLGVTSSLAWPPPVDEVEQGALALEVMKYENVRLGVVLSPSANEQDLPDALKPIVLDPEKIQGGISYLLSVGRVVEYPIVKREDPVTYVPMRIEAVDTGMLYRVGEENRLRVFVRWGNYVLPTLPLMTALDGLGLTLADVQVEFGKELNLGDKRILPIDSEGGIAVSNGIPQGVSRVSATELVNSNVTGLLLDSDKELKEKMASARVVLLGEGDTPVADLGAGKKLSPLNWNKTLDVNASGVFAIMGGLAPGKSVSLEMMGRMPQLIILLDILVAATWALTLTKPRRRITFISLFAIVFVVAMVSTVYADLWLPLFPTVIGLTLACILSSYLHRGKREETEDETVPEMEEEDLLPVPPPLKKSRDIKDKSAKNEESLPEKGVGEEPALTVEENSSDAKSRARSTGSKKVVKASEKKPNVAEEAENPLKTKSDGKTASLSQDEETAPVEGNTNADTIFGAVIKPPSIKTPSKRPAKKPSGKSPRQTPAKKKTPTKRKGKEK